MQMRVSSDGEIVVPGRVLERLGFGPGDVVDVTVTEVAGLANGNQSSAKPAFAGKIIDDPITGLPVIDFGPDTPILTHEEVQAMLVDFP
jgi:hypothetical protein